MTTCVLLICVLMKVQFGGTRTLMAVETRGYIDLNGSSFYVAQYRLEISLDCATFQPILGVNGNNEVCCATFS